MNNTLTPARRAARAGRSASVACLLRPLLLAWVLLAGPAASRAQAPAFTQAVGFDQPTGTSIGWATAGDAAGNQYVTGGFRRTVVFGADTLVAVGGEDFYVAKRSTTSGAWLWAVRAGGISGVRGTGVAVDVAGNALVTGLFFGTATFATSPAATTLGLSGGLGVFVAKFGAANGACAWAVGVGGGGGGFANAVAVDAAGNALVTGVFGGTADFGTGPTPTRLTSAGSTDVFVAKFGAANGACAWAARAGGTDEDRGNGVAVDAAGNALVTGEFRSTADFDTSPAATNLVSAGLADGFVAKFGATTGACAWAVQAGGSGDDRGIGVAVDAAGNALVTGEYKNVATFGSTPTATRLTSAGDYDIFVAKLGAATGATAWAVRAGSVGYDRGGGVAVDAAGNAVVTGHYGNGATFGTLPAATNLASAGLYNTFVARFGAAAGTVAWVLGAGGRGGCYGIGVAVAAAGNALVTGSFTGVANFGSQTITTNGTTGFVAVVARAGVLSAAAAVSRPPLAATLAPNPARTAFTLTLPPIAGTATATATLLNALGQTVDTRTLALAATGTTATYPTAGLAPGLYTLRVRAGGQATALRVVVE